MADELVRSYVDREAFASDTKFILDEINKGRQAIADANEARKSIRVASSGKDIASASEAGAKATIMLSESTKAVTNLMKERFATEAKLVTIQTDSYCFIIRLGRKNINYFTPHPISPSTKL